MRHCSALLRKQVFPRLRRPVPRVAPEGHDVSKVPVYSCPAFFFGEVFVGLAAGVGEGDRGFSR